MRFQIPAARTVAPRDIADIARLLGVSSEEISKALSQIPWILDLENCSFKEAESRLRQLPEQSSGRTIAFLWCLSLVYTVEQAETLFLGLPPESELRYFVILKMAENLNLYSRSHPHSHPHKRRREGRLSDAITGNDDRQG